MPETILVVEYEPRYTDRVRQALAGQPFTTAFAKDGDEALRAIAATRPTLIVLSSVIPRTTTSDLIRAIRRQNPLEQTPILLTVSGYTGKMPKADAERVGASDILPKPYTENDFLGKVQQMLGIGTANPDYVVHGTIAAEGQLTSSEIFGDLLADDKPAAAAAKKINVTGDVDKMLESTLAGMMPQRKTSTGIPRPVTSPGTEPRPRTQPGAAELDKILHDTLSGLEEVQDGRRATRLQCRSLQLPSRPRRHRQHQRVRSRLRRSLLHQSRRQLRTARPVVVPAAPVVEKVPLSSPVIQSPAPLPVIEKPAEEEQEPVDGIRFGQYVLLDKIATGGMAEVWKARMRGVEGFQKIVAIKKILPHLSDNHDFIAMFIDEAKLAAQLTHRTSFTFSTSGRSRARTTSPWSTSMDAICRLLKKAQDVTCR